MDAVTVNQGQDEVVVAAPRAPLDNYANNSSPFLNGSLGNRGSGSLAGASDLRRRRYARRGLLWDLSGMSRVRRCGRTTVMPGGGVAVRRRAGVAGFSGLATCGSVWADPVCNAKIMARRAVEIGAAVSLWQAAGNSVAFLTFTMRHHRGQPLADLWDALREAWGRTTSGRWNDDRARFGVAGVLRVVEVTYGVNGWHVHVHALVFLEGRTSSDAAAALHGRMFGRWSRRLVALGFGAPLAVGQDAQVLRGAADPALAAYLTKSTDAARAIGLEVTQTQTKNARGRHSTRPPWALLDDVEQQGEAASLDLWHEWERGSKNRKQMTWSQGLRQRLGLLAEQSDEDVAAEEHGSADDDLVLIDAAGWAMLTAGPPGDLADLLAVTEAGGLAALRPWLDRRQVSYDVLDREAA